MVAVTNTLTVMSVFESFLEQPTASCVTLGIVYLPTREKLVALIDQNGRLSLVSKTTSKGQKLSFELPPQCGHQSKLFYPTCITRSTKEGYILLGGSDAKDPRMGTAVVTIYRLEDSLISADSITIQDGSFKSMVASCIAKLPERDIFVVGTYCSVFVVEWNNIQLGILASFPNQHTCKI